MKRFINGFSQITTVLTVSVIILSAVFVIPRFFGVVPYIVRSGSMEPVIHTGSVAFINQGDREVRPGDIVTYRLTGPSGSDTLVTHRVIRVQDGVYTTRGDANETEDLSPVTREQLVGTYVCQIPCAGYLMAYISPRTALAAAVWILLLNGASMAMSWAASP